MALLSNHKRPAPRVRVLLIERSPVLRQTWRRAIADDGSAEVVDAVASADEARSALVQARPDVLVMGLDLDGCDVPAFVRRLMRHHPLPIVVVASPSRAAAAVDALAAGAIDVATPPDPCEPLARTTARLISAVTAASLAGVKPVAEDSTSPQPLASTAVDPSAVVALGAGAGGVRAMIEVISRWPADGPAALLATHLPAGFTRVLAEKLQSHCAAQVTEARNGDVIHAGRILVAPAGRHSLVRRGDDRLVIDVKDGPAIAGHKPSIDVLFDSLARVSRGRTAAGVLSGMGLDGAAGLLRLRKAGARTVAEAESSSVVSAMPFAAATAGGAECVVELGSIAGLLLEWSADQARSRTA